MVNYPAVAILCILFAELAKYDGNLLAGINVMEFILGIALVFNLLGWCVNWLDNRKTNK